MNTIERKYTTITDAEINAAILRGHQERSKAVRGMVKSLFTSIGALFSSDAKLSASKAHTA